ncbi:MAG: hypothetical protein VB045_07475 [Synergistaceae bacterium]|nr:hypothetical protein [Synergistaceae bacterium]
MISVFALRASAADEQWTSYDNERFGYSVEYPEIFTDVKESDNGDGVWFSTEDDKYGLTLSGGFNVLEEDGEARLRSRLENVAHIVPGSDESGPGWYRVIYSDDGGKDGNEHLFHEYGIIDKENWSSFILVYPLEEQERFVSIAANMEKTLLLPPSDGDESKKLRTDAFVLTDGRVVLDGTPLGCEVHEAPPGLENGIAGWAVIGMETSDTVTEEETGVWFFGAEGQFVTFIPLESENEYQGLLWSPAGDRLVLVRGSGMRPDVFFELYAEGMEKKAEFSGMLGQIEWLEDGMRFVFTRIDDIREGGAEPGVSIGWKLSAILYDSAIEEAIPLKESTNTKNFSFDSVSEDGENLVLYEMSVKSTKDWGNEDKMKEREITVPVPPAG